MLSQVEALLKFFPMSHSCFCRGIVTFEAVFDAAMLNARASLSMKPDRFFADASVRSAPGHCPKAVESMSRKTPGSKKHLPLSSRVHVGKRAHAVHVP